MEKYFIFFSDPPRAVYIGLQTGQKFKICEYGWWDHSLAIGNTVDIVKTIYLIFKRQAENLRVRTFLQLFSSKIFR
jgi:hypothetical protein